MGKQDLLAVYKSTILPMHDYCSTVFNSSLTITQSGQLERLQAMALKAIFGFDHSYCSLLSLSGLTSLKQRRDKRGDLFAAKCLANPRLSSWFPLHVPVRLTPLPPQTETEWQRGLSPNEGALWLDGENKRRSTRQTESTQDYEIALWVHLTESKIT